MKANFTEKLFWIKKAASLNMETKRGQREFYLLAQESKLGRMWLSYYANAYKAAGESGLKALTFRKKMPPEIRQEAVDKIKQYLSAKVPQYLHSVNIALQK